MCCPLQASVQAGKLNIQGVERQRVGEPFQMGKAWGTQTIRQQRNSGILYTVLYYTISLRWDNSFLGVAGGANLLPNTHSRSSWGACLSPAWLLSASSDSRKMRMFHSKSSFFQGCHHQEKLRQVHFLPYVFFPSYDSAGHIHRPSNRHSLHFYPY